MTEEQEKLPKPLTDLPLPEKDLPLPEKELPEHASEPKQTSSTNENENPKGSMVLKSFLLGILFVILVVLIGGGSFFLGRNTKDKNQQITETIVSAPSVTPDPTADWGTYEGDGFSFNYPAFLKISEDNKDKTVFFSYPENSGPNAQRVLFQISTDKSSRYFSEGLKNCDEPDTETAACLENPTNDSKVVRDTTLAGIPAKEFYYTEPIGSTPHVIQTLNPSIFILSWDIKDDKIFNQILSTFKFTDTVLPTDLDSDSPTLTTTPASN